MFNRKLPTAALICSIALVPVLAGCGGGGSTSSLTKAEFVKQGDAICKKVNEERSAAIQAYLLKHQPPPGHQISQLAELKVITAAALPPIKGEAEKLGELGAPEGEEEKVSAIVEGLEKAVEEAEENAVSTLSPKTNPFNEVSQLATKYGFKECAQFGG